MCIAGSDVHAWVCSNTNSNTLLSRCQCLCGRVFVQSSYTTLTKERGGGGGGRMFPWKCCELHDALNLFGCSCQANEVSEWGRPGGGRGQPKASAACQAALLWDCSPGPDWDSGHGTAPWRGLAHSVPICHTSKHCMAKAGLHCCMSGPLVHVESMHIGTSCETHTHTLFVFGENLF